MLFVVNVYCALNKYVSSCFVRSVIVCKMSSTHILLLNLHNKPLCCALEVKVMFIVNVGRSQKNVICLDIIHTLSYTVQYIL